MAENGFVRPAERGDAAAIGFVHHTAWQETYTGLIDRSFLAARTVTRSTAMAEWEWPHMSVAVWDGRVVGFCGCGEARDKDLRGAGEIQGIYLLRAFQHLGLGCALLEDALCRLRAAGYTSVYLWVLSTNENARRFYEKNGFTPDGAEKTEILGEPITEVRYVRALCEVRSRVAGEWNG
ncbi:MAG: GNAT family N-acetyltransferase [Hominenteromicrobium sp.]